MLKELLSNRWIQGGLVFFVLVVSGSLLHFWLVKRAVDAEFPYDPGDVQVNDHPPAQDTGGTRHPRPVDLGTAAPSLDAEDSSSVSDDTAEHSPSETAAETSETEDSVSVDALDPSKMSRFGLGPYPEIPKDGGYPLNYFETADSIERELLRRVHVKMYNEGILDKYSSVGINHGTGLVTPIEYGSLLVEYETDENGDQRLVRTKGHPDLAPPGGVYTHVSEIPSHIKIVTAEEVSFDPYEYLGLSR